MLDLSFYKGKRVLVTGHTGFKGSWLCNILLYLGAKVYGYSLEPPTKPNLYELSGIDKKINSCIGDIRDYIKLKEFLEFAKPDIVLHLAAQPIVRDSYKDPRYTYEVNVMGTVNILECIRTANGNVKSFLNVTTDKVYQNNEWVWGYRETDALDGFDPYSNSKSCSELVTHSYSKSFFQYSDVKISTARAGNVIGGGDFANDRIIPDCARATKAGQTIFVRNPNSIRPYQHVLEPLLVYLMICEKQYIDKSFAGNYNVGPNDSDCITTGELVDRFCSSYGENCSWTYNKEENAPHEANFLKLDCSLLKNKFGWKPEWNINQTIDKTVEWYKAWIKKEDINAVMNSQIKDFMGEVK